jgi:hypothetical protein
MQGSDAAVNAVSLADKSADAEIRRHSPKGSSLRSRAKATAIARNCTGYRRPALPTPWREASSRNLFTRASIGAFFRGAQDAAAALPFIRRGRARSYG